MNQKDFLSLPKIGNARYFDVLRYYSDDVFF